MESYRYRLNESITVQERIYLCWYSNLLWFPEMGGFIKQRQRHLSQLNAFDTGHWSHTATQTFSYSVWEGLRLTFLNGIFPKSGRQWTNLSLQSCRCKLWHSQPLCLSHWFSKRQAPRRCKQIPCSPPLPSAYHFFLPLFRVVWMVNTNCMWYLNSHNICLNQTVIAQSRLPSSTAC